jgi:putative ABC transport system ATP-binding protein
MIKLENVTVEYRLRNDRVLALDNINLDLPEGGFLAIMGPSGSGKTTLMQLIAGMLTPTTGNVIVSGQNLRLLDDQKISQFRNRTIGFVFQSFHLLPYHTALDNVALPLVFAGIDEKTRRNRARQVLTELGLADRINHRPDELSGGEAQRVAIARALINNPKIILADEPTGNLDRANSDHVMSLLTEISTNRGMTILMVTHDDHSAKRAAKTLHLDKGRLI